MQVLPAELQENDQIYKAVELCEEGAFTPEELSAYDAYWDIVRTEKSIRITALQEGLTKGEAIGLTKGEAIGLTKGEAIGLTKGEAIGSEKEKAIWSKKMEQEQKNVVINSHRVGLPIATISTITGFTSEEVMKILEEAER
jgi:hypothetical protein